MWFDSGLPTVRDPVLPFGQHWAVFGIDSSCSGVSEARRMEAHAILSSTMKASLLYRISSILLLLFAAGHTLGFRQIDPKWGVDSLVQSMKTIHFNANGSDRTYWNFFVGFGFFVTVLMVFASIIAWQFGSLPTGTLAAAAWLSGGQR
jgi:hypothetical protein